MRFWLTLMLGLAASVAQAAAPLPALEAKQVETLLAPDARAGLDAAVLTGQFTQAKHLAGLPQPLRSSGRFLYAKGIGIEWQVQQPFASRFVLTREALVEDSGGRVRRSEAAKQPGFSAVSRLLLALFSLDVAALDEEFRFSGARDAKGWQLELTPRHAALASVFATARLEGARRLDRLTLTDARGDATEIAFTQQAAQDALTPEQQARLK